MSQENIKITNSIYEEFNQRNYSGVLGFFDADFEWVAADHSPLADHSPYRGLEKVREGVFDRINAGFEYLEIRADEIIDAGDKVVMLGYYDGVFKANGQPFQAQVAHVWTFGGDKALKFQQYVDTLQIAESARQTAD
jgi:ketosteroid isomerase-like protein